MNRSDEIILLPSAHFEEALIKPLYHMGHSHMVGLVKELNYFNRLDEHQLDELNELQELQSLERQGLSKSLELEQLNLIQVSRIQLIQMGSIRL